MRNMQSLKGRIFMTSEEKNEYDPEEYFVTSDEKDVYNPKEKERIKSEIIHLIRKYHSVTFPQLNRKIEKFKGNREMGLLEHNIIFWAGLSKEAIVAINELEQEKFFRFEDSDILIYGLDGEILTYPIAKQHRKYKKPRWAPVMLVLND